MNLRVLRIIAFIAIPLFILTLSSSYIFEWLWLSEVGYSQIFWTLRGTQVVLTLLAFIIASLFFIPNFRFLAEQLKNANLSGSPLQGSNIDLNTDFASKRIKQFFTLGGLIMAVIFALSFYIRWDESLRFISSVPFGEVDPMFGRDISFFMFELPFWDLAQSSFTSIVFITLIIITMAYIFTGLLMVRSFTDFNAGKKVLNHIKINVVAWLGLVAWGLYLDRYNLVYKADGIVFGAGYTDVMYQLPAIWIMFVLTIALALLILVSRWVNTSKAIPGLAVLTVVVLILGRAALPGMVQKFNVEPNELELESPYLERNIEMTRLAYNLHNVQEVEYQANDTLTVSDITNNRDAIDNIRLWDSRLLINTYKQLQEIRSYYEFYSVDNDRYTVDGDVTQMMLSAREIARTLPSQSDTWVNRHLQYTHGYGLVMSPVTETNSQGEPRLSIRNLPPSWDSDDLKVDNPAIYYGENSSGYYVVNSGIEELHYPDGDANVYTHYSGNGGIQISDFFRKLLFAWELGDINILLTDYITEDSRLQIWRSVQERIRKITPFLELDRDPYLVLNDGRLYWVQDAYTTSSHFPYSQRYRNSFNYIRNSVKIVVDAYEGTVDYYIVDENDPVLEVYDSIFPGVFKSLDELPEGIENQFRYPQDLFEIQIETFSRYHMTTPQVFYNQEDLWTRPNEKYGGRQMLMDPYYVLARLPGENELEFMLISPLTPENRDNMISWMTAKSDPGNYGDLIVYKLPKERLIYGPAQIEARIDQDPEISRQIALWDQRGSSVIRGNLMVIPIENSFLYVEPVFLIAEGVDIPQLQRVIVAIGDAISMQPTLDEALFDLFGDEAAPIIATSPLVNQDNLPETALTEETAINRQALDEIRSIWNDLKEALENGDWNRYGELLGELEDKINDLQ
ncbi:UPF0182 family protein [Rhodohalobacter barkolensis]|uniref:UPF0182 protein CWD77_08265 n=1 Tax=Rhodohalobacter barkolensis TaxID=2053187 RepID=A0A2N0VH89_9BACT|nr:UPF0182 family protein [Rhodohalobacter barkolensis]PKD43552.1 UPF0182 family protein [Rhodohalobacter barkolensis]